MINTAKLAEALMLCLEINEDETPRIAFFTYSGHTEELLMDVYKSRPDDWSNPLSEYWTFEAYLDSERCKGRVHPTNDPYRFADFDEMIEFAKEVYT